MAEFIVGKNPVEEALRAGRPLSKIWLAQGAKRETIREIMALARQKQIPYQFVQKERLAQLAGNEGHQGIVAQVGAKSYLAWPEIIARARQKKEEPLLVLLDGLEDPRNFGAILRTAEAVGVHGVIIPKHRAVALTATVGKASAGAIEYVPVARVTNLPQVMERLKEEGFWLVGADAQASQKYCEADLRGPLVLVLGSEGQGLSRLVREKCDFLVSIPMCGQLNSLNVAVAGGLLFYEVLRQRNLL